MFKIFYRIVADFCVTLQCQNYHFDKNDLKFLKQYNSKDVTTNFRCS